MVIRSSYIKKEHKTMFNNIKNINKVMGGNASPLAVTFLATALKRAVA